MQNGGFKNVASLTVKLFRSARCCRRERKAKREREREKEKERGSRIDKFWNICVLFRERMRGEHDLDPFNSALFIGPPSVKAGGALLFSFPPARHGVSAIHLIKPQWKGRVGGDEEITLPVEANWHIFQFPGANGTNIIHTEAEALLLSLKRNFQLLLFWSYQELHYYDSHE